MIKPVILTMMVLTGSVSAVAGARAQALDEPAVVTEKPERSLLLPVMYVTLGATQTWDLLSTSASLRRGAREMNPLVSQIAGHNATLIAVKAASTAGTIFFVERLRKKSRSGAIAVMFVINGSLATVAMLNTRNARLARVR